MPQEPAQILIVDDEPNMLKVLGALLRREGYHTLEAGRGDEAVKLLEENHVDTLITDMRMPGKNGMELLDLALKRHPGMPVIMITAHGTIDTAVEALKKGAFDYITKPWEWNELRTVIQKAVQTARFADREIGAESIAGIGGERPEDLRIIGTSEPMRQVFEVVEKVANTPSTILMTGESGTGKDLIAREIHLRSRWSTKPFIKVNCAAIPRELLESELFGYEKGAFTGAVTSKPGRFELANGGTIFLDEIGEMDIGMQVKLLRVVQDLEFERVGGIRTCKVETRLITGTNVDLRKAVADGRFRQDLFYRLNIVNIHLPPLRDRRSDIPPLCEHFLRKFNSKLEKQLVGFTPEASACICAHDWPGNIRELENVIERAVLLDDDNIVGPEDLPPELHPLGAAFVATPGTQEGLGLKEAIRAETTRIERDLIVHALDLTRGNVTQAARHLKISRKSMQIKMKELGLREDSPR